MENNKKIMLSETAKTEIRKLHQEYINNHYTKIKSFWQRSEFFHILQFILILIWIVIFLIGIIYFLVATYTSHIIVQWAIYLGIIGLIGTVVTPIIFLIIKSTGIILTVFLNRLDFNKYYEIAINDYFKQQVELIKVNKEFDVLPIPNFVSFNKDPKKNNLLNQSITQVNSLQEKSTNKIINGKIKIFPFSLGVITVRKTMKTLKAFIILLGIALIIAGSNNSNKNNSSFYGQNNYYLGYWLMMIEIKKSDNYFFFTCELPIDNKDEFNIVPKQNNFKKFIINYDERILEGTEFVNLFDTNSTNELTLRKIITPKVMINLINLSKKYQERLSMSIVNNTFTLLLDKYQYSKKENYDKQIFLPNISHKKNILTCIDEIIEKIEIDLYHLEKAFNYLNSFDIIKN